MKLAVIGSKIFEPAIMHSSYHMALGQELVRDPEYYAMYQRFHFNGDFIIVDNGAAEPVEERVDFEKIVEVCINWADEIIMPDELGNRKLTLTRLETYWGMVPERQRMVVPQGSDPDDWMRCFMEIEEMCSGTLPTVGLPKFCEQWPGGRAGLVQRLCDAECVEDYWLHALGIWKNPHDEIAALRKYKCVRGIDTGAPIAYAQHSASMSDSEHYSLDWEADATWELTVRNVETMKRWCNAFDV